MSAVDAPDQGALPAPRQEQWLIDSAVVVDDDAEFRRSLDCLLQLQHWKVLLFGDPRMFLASSDALPPSILLLDMRMPDLSGLDLLEDRRLDRFATIMMTGHGDIPSAVRSLKSGAVDFLEKPFFAAELARAMDSGRRRLQERLQIEARKLDAERRIGALSRRERQILAGLLSGGSNKSIAKALSLSSRTVELYRSRMMDKLGVRTSMELAHLATLSGFLGEELRP